MVMELIQIDITKQNIEQKNRVACIGFFESLHIAHQQLLQECLKYEGIKTFITFVFDNDIQISKNIQTYLMRRDQKIELVKSFGFDEYVEIIFNKNTQALSYLEFEKVLKEMGIHTLVCGFDFKYGKERKGSIQTLKQCEYFDLIVVDEVNDEEHKISSTQIKQLLDKGEIEKVNQLLRRPYSIRAKVIEGKKLGRKIGFPTANLENQSKYHTPKIGVYFGKVIVRDQMHYAMISVGLNPTVEVLQKPVIESHILDFNQDIYNEEVDVLFIKRLRDEIKFDSLESLISQLEQDEKEVRRLICD